MAIGRKSDGRKNRRNTLLGAVAAAALAATGLTGVGFTGTKSFLLKLKKGSYRFVCDPHSDSMRGRVLVS